MKITTEELTQILAAKPVQANELELKEVFALLGFKLKEYSKASLSPFQSFEVHYRRTYLFKLEVDDTRCLSLSNEFINFGDGCHGMSFGGVDTVKEVIQTVILMAQKLNSGYDGQIGFNEAESEYTEEEYAALIEVLNEAVFNDAE
jgi:hypothetical protein